MRISFLYQPMTWGRLGNRNEENRGTQSSSLYFITHQLQNPLKLLEVLYITNFNLSAKLHILYQEELPQFLRYMGIRNYACSVFFFFSTTNMKPFYVTQQDRRSYTQFAV